MSNDETRIGTRIWRVLKTALLLLCALPCFYLLGALVGALVPRNPGWQEPTSGVLVFVRNNGVHVDIVLPASAAAHDLYRWVPPKLIADPGEAGGWVAFGWGQREFYLETPSWSDLTLGNAARGVFGGNALMHVEYIGPPHPASRMRPLLLEHDAYSRLVARIAGSFAVQANGQPVPLVGTGYANNDVFYEATGRYNALRTSNQWAANALAEAGVELGIWTPFAQGVMWRFRRPA